MSNRTAYGRRSPVRLLPLSSLEDPARPHSWDACRAAAGRDRTTMEAVADHVGRSISWLEKCFLPYGGENDSGRRNPAALLYDFVTGCLEAGVPFWIATKPLVWCARRLGLDVVQRQPADVPEAPFEVASELAVVSGRLEGAVVTALDPDSEAGSDFGPGERRAIAPVLDEVERRCRQVRALTMLEAA